MVIGSSFVGRVIGSYRIIAEVAHGAFGSVYTGKHVIFTSRGVVAIKLLHTHLSSPQEREMFFQEAQLLEMLKHPYILPIIDAGIHEGFPYLVVEFASRGSLRERLQSLSPQPLPIEEALTILSQVGQALQHAHQQNIIHRDLKPENILFNDKGDTLLADFGIATILTTASVKQSRIIGTPLYMAPEQFRGIISRESDQYALGCIAYELFTGSKPFTAPDFVALMFKHVTDPPIAPRQINQQLSLHIEQAILKAMAKERADRHTDISAFITALQTASQLWLEEGEVQYTALNFEKALFAYEQAIQRDPHLALTYYRKGRVLNHLQRYEEALSAYEQAIQLDPKFFGAYLGKGRILQLLSRDAEALSVYDQIIQLDPYKPSSYFHKGNFLRDSGRYKEALRAFEQNTRLDPNDVDAWVVKWDILRKLEKDEEAEQAYERVIQLGGKDHPLIEPYYYDNEIDPFSALIDDYD